MTKSRVGRPPTAPPPSAIVAELEERFLAHLSWALINTREDEDKLNALPKEERKVLKEEVGLRPHRQTPNELADHLRARQKRSPKKPRVGKRKRKEPKPKNA